MSEAEIDRLPEPELFRDALFLAEHGTWTPTALDDVDTLTFALVQRLKRPRPRTPRWPDR